MIRFLVIEILFWISYKTNLVLFNCILLETISFTEQEPKFNSLSNSSLNWGNSATSGILNDLPNSICVTSMKSSYFILSNGLNVTGKTNVVPGLREIVLGNNVLKNLVFGSLIYEKIIF